MAQTRPPSVPAKTFFLNERQELSPFERKGGGRASPLADVNWQQKGEGLVSSFRKAVATPPKPADPLRAAHHFVLAVPAQAVVKLSKAKDAQDGRVSHQPNFSGEQSRLFRRMGMDLLETLPGGVASVHVPAARVAQLLSTMSSLAQANAREQARWVNVAEFREMDWTTRVDESWLSSLESGAPVEAFVRFQPTLTRVEIQDLLQALSAVVGKGTQVFTRAGRSFSGRYWCWGSLTREQLKLVATQFPSVQSIHPRQATALASSKTKVSSAIRKKPVSVPAAQSVEDLPTVAVVDSGIPSNHPQLASFLRAGFRNPNLDPTVTYIGDHGSTVASCIVFGDVPSNTSPPMSGTCRVIDVMVALDQDSIQDEILQTAIDAILGTTPEVRVFNMSFDRKPLKSLSGVERREDLLKLQDLDNLAFARDIVMVLAAGNSAKGLIPEQAYPDHAEDPRWSLGAYACSFNGLVCGAHVGTVGADCVAGILGAPSPFTRIGPGLVNSPVPGFSAPGGDATSGAYQYAPGTGVGVFTAAGIWEDRPGTSLAAPLVARETAWILHELRRHCGPGTTPFAGTVKAWMNLVAKRPELSGAHERLALRTLGRGQPSAERLRQPLAESAVFIWQTVLQAPQSVATVVVPIPPDWLAQAREPRLRVIAAWNSPVNAALEDLWACRKVTFKLRPFGGSAALRPLRSASAGTYTLLDRTYRLNPERLPPTESKRPDSLWTIEVEYDEIGEYPAGMTVSPQQRVGVVLELWDEAEVPVGPQSFIQALPLAIELDRLSILQSPLQVPISIQI